MRFFVRFFICIIALANIYAPDGAANTFPVTVQSCGRTVTVPHPPKRLITHDINITEIALALGLSDKIVGVTGISGWHEFSAAFQQKLHPDTVELSRKYPSLEVILNAQPDFVFAGWNYGFTPTSDFNPARLAEFGIPSYELKESCVHVGQKHRPADMQDLYDDILAIGTVFGIKHRAIALVQSYKRQIADIVATIPPTPPQQPPQKVFVFDDISDAPFTAGAYGMPSALITAVGAVNAMENLQKSWARVSWEQVASANPDAYIIVDYGANTAAQKIQYLLNLPAIQHTNGIRKQVFIVLKYAQVTPSPHNISAIRSLKQALYK